MLQSYVKAGGQLQGLSDAELFCLDLMKVDLGWLLCWPGPCFAVWAELVYAMLVGACCLFTSVMLALMRLLTGLGWAELH